MDMVVTAGIGAGIRAGADNCLGGRAGRGRVLGVFGHDYGMERAVDSDAANHFDEHVIGHAARVSGCRARRSSRAR